MGHHLIIYGRKLVVCFTAFVYSLHYWINCKYWQQGIDNLWQCLHITFTNIVFLFLTWCFIVMLITDPGTPTKADERSFQPFSRKGFCIQCKQPKPDRCHVKKDSQCQHCSVCDRCILQMDHHCPWINTCVGYQNRKQFILLLLYALLFNTFTIMGTTKYYILQFVFSPLNIFYALICLSNYILAFQLAIFFKYHIDLLYRNQTTLEDIINKRNQIPYNVFDVGEETNIRQLFGSNKLMWFFPIYTAEGCDDGNFFPVKNDIKYAPPAQVTSIIYEQQIVNSDKTKHQNPIIERFYQQENEKQKLNEIIKQ